MEEEIIKEGCESNNCETPIKPVFPLWIIHYFVRGDKKYQGMAIVKAPDCKIAQEIFKSKTAHNGNLDNLYITEIREVYALPCPDLLAEEYLDHFPHKLPPQRKIGKRHV